MSKSKALIAASLALAGMFAAGGAQAGSADVQWSVTFGSNAPIGIFQAPVVHYPVPVHTRPQVVQVAHRHDRDGDGIPNWHDRYDNRRSTLPVRHDVDRDGIPNWSDRHDNRRSALPPRHDVDRDGIPNWHDRHDNRRYR
jgi:hypothetical protein